MKVKNDNAAGATDAEGNTYEWKAGSTVEVPDAFAAELFAIADGGFYDPKEFTEVDPTAIVEVDPYLGGVNTEPLAVVEEPEDVLKDLPAPGDLVEAQTGKLASELADDSGLGEHAHDEDRDAKVEEGQANDKPKRGRPAKK